jgi:hypothetical protein
MNSTASGELAWSCHFSRGRLRFGERNCIRIEMPCPLNETYVGERHCGKGFTQSPASYRPHAPHMYQYVDAF